MKKIIKKKITKGFLLFLFTFLSIGVQAQWDEYGGGSGGCDPDSISATEQGGTFDSNGVNEYGIQRTFDHNEEVEVPQSTAYGASVIVSIRAVYTYSCAQKEDNPFTAINPTTLGGGTSGVGTGGAGTPPCTLQESYCTSIGRILANCACVEKPCAITSCPTGFKLVNCGCVIDCAKKISKTHLLEQSKKHDNTLIISQGTMTVVGVLNKQLMQDLNCSGMLYQLLNLIKLLLNLLLWLFLL